MPLTAPIATPEEGTPPRPRIWLPLGFVVLTLIALVVVPVLVDRQTNAIREEIATVHEPARTLVTEIQMGVTLESAAIRQFAHGDPSSADRYRDARARTDDALQQLRAYEPALSPPARARLEALEAEIARWHARHDPLLRGEMPREQFLREGPTNAAQFEAALASVAALERELILAHDEQLHRVDSLGRRGTVFTAVLACGALAATALLGVIDRRLEQRAERALALHRQALHARQRALDVLESIADGFFSVDRLWRFTYLNRRAAEAMGRSREELVGQEVWEVVQGFLGPDFEPSARRAMTDQVPVEFETHRADTGEWLHVHVFPAADGLTVYVDDITERKRAEGALLETSERLEALVRAVPIPTTVLDLQGRVVLWNPAAERVFGWQEAEVLGRRTPLVPDDALHELRQELEAASRGEAITGLVTHRLSKDGARLAVRLSTAPLREGDAVRGMVALLEDVTERRRTEQRVAVEHAVTRILAESSRADEPMPRILRAVCEQLDWDFGEFWAVHPSGDSLQLVDVHHARSPALERFAAQSRSFGFRRGEGLPGRAWETGEVAWMRDVVGDPGFRRRAEAREAGLHTAFAFPVRTGDAFFGVMCFFLREVAEADARLARTMAKVGSEIGQFILRKRAEEEERRLTAIVENTPDFVGFADAQGRVQYVNPAGRALIGLGPDDGLAGRTIAGLHPEWAAAQVLAEGMPAALQDGAWTGESVLLGRDGEDIPVSQVIVAHRAPTGEVQGWSTILRDMRERKRLESGQQFLVEASQVLVSTLDYESVLERLARLVVPRLADYCLVDVVEGAEIRRVAAVHRDPDEEPRLSVLRNQPVTDDLAVGVSRVVRSGESELVPQVTDAMLRALAQDDEHLEALHALGPSSSVIVPLRARGRIVGTLTCVTSTSGRRYGREDLELVEELARRAALAVDNARLYREAVQATNVRDQVLRIVAHDLRNPLQSISLAVGLLLRRLPHERAPEREPLRVALRSAEHAQRLIQDLLEVAKLDAGGIAVDRRPEDVAALVRDVADLERPLAEEKGLALEVVLPESLPLLPLDRDRIVQVLVNLVGNAIKFTDRGAVTLGAEPVEGAVRFWVSDTGPGIAADELPHLFDPFWQAQRTAKAGTGLGLAIARGIVEAHDAHIEVRSEPGVGTTFTFDLPLAPATSPPDLEPA